MALPWHGGCRCGEVRFQIETAPALTCICHCHGCQHMSGSAFSTTVMVVESGFSVVQGQPVIGGAHTPGVLHNHCPNCKSWLFTRVEPGFGLVNVRATQLDDNAWFKPFVELQTAEKLPWATTSVPRSYARFPMLDEWGELVAQYGPWLASMR